MQLLPFRQYGEEDVINLYALVEASGDAGCLAEAVSMNPSIVDEFVDGGLAPYSKMYSPRIATAAKAQLATSGSDAKVVGVMLYNVREYDDLGRKLILENQRYNELQVVISGQTCPMLRQGMVTVKGFDGVAGPGSGIGVSNAGAGNWKVLAAGAAGSLGQFLSTTGNNGQAIAFINI